MLLNSLLSEHTNIETVDNGEEAVKACQSKRYNVILLDLQMPKLNGLDAARMIRQESMLNKQTPIVVISANSPDLNKERLQKSGVDLCLQKPIDEKQLLNHLLLFLKNQRLPLSIGNFAYKKSLETKRWPRNFLLALSMNYIKTAKSFYNYCAIKTSRD